MVLGSYLRFGIGLILSAEIIRDAIFGLKISELAIVLSVAFIFLSILFFAFRF